jgi:chromosome segregation ATPase|tara:strand:- start:576 stop:1028 length:453 start_codon:yes stop_codon:yes gene_type:complete
MVESNLQTKIAVMESDIKQFTNLFGRLDISIEKITELNTSIKEVLAVHEQRISATEVDIERTYDTFEEKYEQLHSRISTTNRELAKDLKDHQTKVMDAVMELRDLVGEHAQHHDDRIRALEKRQWMMMGAAAVLGFLIGNLEFFQLILNS